MLIISIVQLKQLEGSIYAITATITLYLATIAGLTLVYSKASASLAMLYKAVLKRCYAAGF